MAVVIGVAGLDTKQLSANSEIHSVMRVARQATSRQLAGVLRRHHPKSSQHHVPCAWYKKRR